MTINEKQDELIEDLSAYDDWMEKYEHIIGLGKEIKQIEPQYKTEDRLIKGCQSRVWLHADYKNGRIFFSADSDAIITKGLIAMMIQVLSEHTPQEITQADIYFIDKIGLRNHLSPTRANGLLAMLKQMKLYALALTTQN